MNDIDKYGWTAIAIPEDCKSIFVCQNNDLFQAKINAGDLPLLAPREGLSVFITYQPDTDLKHLDVLAGIREAIQDKATGSGPVDKSNVTFQDFEDMYHRIFSRHTE